MAAPLEAVAMFDDMVWDQTIWPGRTLVPVERTDSPFVCSWDKSWEGSRTF